MRGGRVDFVRCIGRQVPGLLIVGVFLCFGSLGNARAAGEGEKEGLLARISNLRNGWLVRARVPVFGVAAGPKFRCYRLEFGEGPSPSQWQTIDDFSIEVVVPDGKGNVDAYARDDVNPTGGKVAPKVFTYK